MKPAASSIDSFTRLSMLHRAIPLRWQVLIGLGGLLAGLLVARVLTWPAAATWRETPVVLLAISATATFAGAAAGMTAALFGIVYYGAAFAMGGLNSSIRNLSWLPLLAIAAVAMAGMAGWLRECLGRLEQEVSGTRTMLQGATRRLEAALEAERLRGYYDHITDLPSRRMVIDRASQVLSHARRSGTLVGLLLLDLRSFKEVNNLVGHDAGDEVLRQIGQRLIAVMRREDTVGRLDSDSFVILLTGLTELAGITIAEQKIAEAMAPAFLVGHPPREVTVSAATGTALFPRDAEDWESLYRFADEALQVGKRMA